MFIYVLLVLLLLIFVFYLRGDHSEYWRQYGVPYYGGKFGLGVALEFLLKKRNYFHILDDIYKAYPNVPVVAMPANLNTILFVKDPRDIQHVLAGDFNSFSDRGIHVNAKVDLLADNLLFMDGPRWKLTRQKVSPIFTSAKLRNMYYIMDKSAQDFIVYLKENNGKENAIGSLSTFCSAAISAGVFGIQTRSTMESPFLDIARKAFAPSVTLNLKFILGGTFPRLFDLLKISLFGKYEDFFIDSIKKVIRMRDEEKVNRHDFAELCLALQKNGTMKDPVTGYEMEPTDELMAAQAFFFFLAGVETSSTCMFFTLFEIARRPDVLERIHSEIDQIFEQNNGIITYDQVMAMEYLDRVIDEALRMHPPIANIFRKCTQKSVLPVGNVHVEKNMIINIPVYSIHFDPKYYPNPEVFDPERFTTEAKQQRSNYTYMPFGEGNRICIGLRFARLQVKTGIIHILRNFTLKTESDINTKVKYVKSPVQLRPKAEITFQFVPRI